MSLQDKLDAYSTASEAKMPAEAVAILRKAIDDLIASGQADRALKAGDRAPGFHLSLPEGEWAQQRGSACAWTARHHFLPRRLVPALKALEDVAADIRALGASLVARFFGFFGNPELCGVHYAGELSFRAFVHERLYLYVI